MRRRWNKRSHRRKRTSSSMTTTTMTMLRIPRARGQLLQKHPQLLQTDLQLLQKHLSRFRQWLPKSHAQNASCICAARAASIHRNLEHQLFSRPMRDRMCARIVPLLRTCQASRQPPRS